MPKAIMNTKSGATVTIEGTQDEVAALLARFEAEDPTGRQSPMGRHPTIPRDMRPTPMGLLGELIAEGFFGQPRELAAVRAALQDRGHFYPVTTLSPLLLRLVRKKHLRRIKNKQRWTYVR
jgi:hypothetical protein